MIPSVSNLVLPVLRMFEDGGQHGKADIAQSVAALYEVSEDELKAKLTYGANKFRNHIGWVLINLKGKELLVKEGQQYRISDLGIRALEVSPDRLTAKFLKSLSETDAGVETENASGADASGGEAVMGTVQEPPAEDTQATEVPESPETSEPEVPEDPPAEEPITSEEPGPSVDMAAYASLDSTAEFAIAVRAKVGDKKAFADLWNKYRPMMVGMFRHCKNLTYDDRVSEAALVFVQKLEMFDPAKVNKSPEDWTFSFMLTGGVKNARDKIIRHSKKESKMDYDYLEDMPTDSAAESENPVYAGVFAESVRLNQYEYEEKYSPELHALRASDTPLEEKEKALMESLSPLQITILKFRQAGLTIKQIADEMGYSFTKVRLQLIEARQMASDIFDVEYCRSR